MKVKVCGITTAEQLQQLESLGVDFAGLIFYEGSKRYAHGKLSNKQSYIKDIGIKKVGVFVNADLDFINGLIQEYDLAAVQLHGDETPAFCNSLKDRIEVIKVFRISDTTSNLDALIAPFQESCHYFLFDTDTTSYGGSGKRFDWSVLESATINKPFFLSGGIGPDDMGILKSFKHPFLHAADINSRFETSPGIKDLELVKRFAHDLNNPYGENKSSGEIHTVQ